jgi:hypothetical protein
MTEPILAARPASAGLPGLAPAELRGPCRFDPDLFFAEDDPAAAAAAKAICGTCPVRVPCLAFALATREPHGVWGGLTAEERRPPADPRTCPRCSAGCPPRRIYCSDPCADAARAEYRAASEVMRAARRRAAERRRRAALHTAAVSA